MSLPNQICGLNTFSGSISKCPPNPNAIRAIVFSRENLAVVNGATTEIQLSLSKFFVPVLNAARTSFSIPGITPAVPMSISKLDLAGMDENGKVKFLALLPTYGTSSNVSSICGSTTASTASMLEYMEWCFVKDLDDGVLFDEPVIGLTSSTTSLDMTSIKKLEFSWGKFMSYTGSTGPIWAATNAGLIKWDSSNMYVWNTLNSNSPTDYLTSIEVDPYNTLWISSNRGISKFNEVEGFSAQYNTTNSDILSDNANTLKLFSVNKIAVATDSGLSITDTVGSFWNNFTEFNTPELYNSNIISLAVDTSNIYVGTTSGIFVYDHVLNTWDSLPYNTSTPGWLGSDNTLSVAVANGVIYAGTDNGLVIIGTGGTADTVFTGVTGPFSNNYKSLRYVNYYGNKLYAGHDDGFSVYDIDNNIWTGASSSFNSYFSGGINDILPDYLSGLTSSYTLFFGNDSLGKGLAKIELPSNNFSLVPESNKNTNLLLSFPLNPSCTPLAAAPGYPGIWSQIIKPTNVDQSRLYPSNQPLYFMFSKPVLTDSISAKVKLSLGLTGSSTAIGGSWSSTVSGKALVFTPTYPLQKANEYNITLTQGGTASDNSYIKEKINVGFYTENIVPILGWNIMGKLLIHTGTEGNYTEGLYLRNPQSTTVNILTLIGR